MDRIYWFYAFDSIRSEVPYNLIYDTLLVAIKKKQHHDDDKNSTDDKALILNGIKLVKKKNIATTKKLKLFGNLIVINTIVINKIIEFKPNILHFICSNHSMVKY